MADISKITLPSGNTYNIKDEVARKIASGAIYLCGTTTTALADQATTASVIIPEAREIRGQAYAAGASYTPQSGDAFFQTNKEFVWDGAHWNEFGDMSGLGALAYKDNGSVTFSPTGDVSLSGISSNTAHASISADASTPDYTPSGTVSAPLVSVNTPGATTTIKNPTAKTVVTDMSVSDASATTATGELVYCSVTGETLTLKKFVETTGASITTSDTTVKTGDATYTATAPNFTGTGVDISVTVPDLSGISASFTGDDQTVSVSFGTNS